MELLRVFNKKRLCIFGLMIILNAVLFIMGNKISEQEIIYRDLVNSYNDNISITEMSKNYLQENPQVSDEDFKEARKIFLERLDYVKNYKERTQNSIDKIKDVQKSSLFSQKNSRSYLELIKSKNDLTKALGYEAKLDNDLWLMKIKDYKYIYWFTGIGCLVVIFSFFNEKENGGMIIYASRNGRLKLLIKRIFILLLFIFTFVIVNYGVISGIALLRYGGIENVFNSAASSLELQLCSYGANRMLYLLIVCIQNTFAFFAWAVMMWGILNLFKNKNVGIVAVIIINLIEMLLYRLIDVKSIYRFLRYFNLYNIFEGNNIWFKNDNWGYNSFIMDSKESQYIISCIIIFAGCILLIYTYIKKHPCDSTGIIEKVVEKLMCRIRYIESKLPVFYFELKKVILYQKTIIVMVFVAIILLNINYGTRLKYDIKNSAMYSFCEEHKMDSTDELKNCKEQLKIENTDTDSSDFNKKFNEELTQEKINYLQYIIDKKENGFNVSTVSQYKYESPFFKRQFFNQEIIALLLTVLGLYLNAGLISFEKKNNMIMNIRACKERKRWLIKKAVINCVILSGIACLVYICYYNKLFNIYEINDLSVGIHSIQAFSDYPFNVSILGVVVLDILYKIVLINSVAVFSYVTTGLFSYQVSFLVSLIVLIPSILDLIGVKLFSYLSVIKLISFFYYWKASYAVVMFGGVLTLMIIAIMVIVYVLGGEYGINSK